MHHHLLEECLVLKKRELLGQLGVVVNFLLIVVLILNIVPADDEALHLEMFLPCLAPRLELGRKDVFEYNLI